MPRQAGIPDGTFVSYANQNDQVLYGEGPIGSDDVLNDSTVPGATVTDALEELAADIADLGSDDIDNDSVVPGATVTDALNALAGGGGGGGGFWQQDLQVWVAPLDPAAVDDLDVNTPFLTIQAAINALAAWQPPGGPGQLLWGQGPLGSYYRAVVNVASGIYDEDLAIPADAFVIFLAWGPVLLGNGLVEYFSSTTKRNVTWTNDQVAEDAGSHSVGGTRRRPTLAFAAHVDAPSSSTHSAYTGGWNITGDLFLNGGVQPSTTVELHLTDTKIVGEIVGTGTPLTGILNCIFYRCGLFGVDKTSAFNYAVGNFNVVESSKFDNDVSAARYGRIVDSEFAGSLASWSGGAQDNLPPLGFINCKFSGVINVGGDHKLWLDQPTYLRIRAGAFLGTALACHLGILTSYGEMEQTDVNILNPFPGSPFPWNTSTQGLCSGDPYITWAALGLGDRLIFGSEARGRYRINLMVSGLTMLSHVAPYRDEWRIEVRLVGTGAILIAEVQAPFSTVDLNQKWSVNAHRFYDFDAGDAITVALISAVTVGPTPFVADEMRLTLERIDLTPAFSP